MPKLPRDPYMGVFENFMERLEEHLYEAMDHVMDTAEHEVDRLITSTQHIANGSGNKSPRKVANGPPEPREGCATQPYQSSPFPTP